MQTPPAKQISVPGQAGPLPHSQLPDGLQLSAFFPQATQALPPEPQAFKLVGLVQAPDWQQPRGQEVASQLQPAAVHCCPTAH